MKQILRNIVPARIWRLAQKAKARSFAGRIKGMGAEELFTEVYRSGYWGRSADRSQRFFSGTGSHDEAIVGQYAKAVARFLEGLPAKPDVVDLGCGDFSTGSRLRTHCGSYIACDIVAPVIAQNRKKYAGLGIDFRTLDTTVDEVPAGDVVFIRQMLQHLSNADIAAVLGNIAGKFRYLVLTEHIPNGNFVPNVDKPTGPDIRLDLQSGVVLTAAPFNVAFASETVLCEAEEMGGRVRTTAYQF